MKIKRVVSFLIFLVFFVLTMSSAGVGKVLYRIDFTAGKHDDPKAWLKEKGVEFRRDADDVTLSFSERGLEINCDQEMNGVFVQNLTIAGGKSIRIKWGVDQYPVGADWEKKILREAVSVLVSFGEKKIDSGAFYIPDMPYFIGLFLGEKEIEGKAYVGNYYTEGGRYVCEPCNNKAGEEVETIYYFEEPFKSFFNKKSVPPISYFALEVDTRDTKGNSKAFIKSIEVHDN